MSCNRKTECREWLRKGDLACRKCPQAKDPQPPEEPVLTGDDEEENEDPEVGGDEDGRERLSPLDFTCPECGDCMSLYADGDGEATCGECGHHGPLSEFDDAVAEAGDDEGDEGDEGDDEVTLDPMRCELGYSINSMRDAGGYLTLAAGYAHDNDAKDSIREAQALLSRARDLVKPYASEE